MKVSKKMIVTVFLILLVAFFVVSKIKSADDSETLTTVPGIVVSGKLSSNEILTNQGSMEFEIRNETDKVFSGNVAIEIDGQGATNVDVQNLNPGTKKSVAIKTTFMQEPKYRFNATGTLSEPKVNVSGVPYEEIFKVDGLVITLFVKAEKTDKDSVVKLVDEIAGKYRDTLGSVHIFDSSQKVKVGEKPNLNNINPVATYTAGDKTIRFSLKNGEYEEFTME